MAEILRWRFQKCTMSSQEPFLKIGCDSFHFSSGEIATENYRIDAKDEAMQAKLKAHELSFLLQILDAQVVVGIDNAELLPIDQNKREELFEAGKAALIEEGWLIPEGRKLQTNDQLMLLVAVAANPDIAIEISRLTPGDGEQKLFYYLAAELIVEQFYSADGHYVLSQLEGISAIVLRLQQIFQPAEESQIPHITLSLSRTGLESGIRQTKDGDWSILERLVSEQLNNMSIDPAKVAIEVGTLNQIGAISIATMLEGQPVAMHEMVVLQSTSNNIWLMSNCADLSTIDLLRFEHGLFGELLQKKIYDSFVNRQLMLEKLSNA